MTQMTSALSRTKKTTEELVRYQDYGVCATSTRTGLQTAAKGMEVSKDRRIWQIGLLTGGTRCQKLIFPKKPAAKATWWSCTAATALMYWAGFQPNLSIFSVLIRHTYWGSWAKNGTGVKTSLPSGAKFFAQ
jgi:hypothetical protein